MVRNLWKAQQKWSQLTRALIREGEDEQTSGQIYLELVQLVLMYGSETWVTTLHIERVLGGLYHRVVHRLMGRQSI